MTNAVNPALAQPHGLKRKADPQGQNKLDRPVFGQTLQAIRTSAAVQSDPRWLAQARLTITVGNADRPVPRQPPEILPPLEPEIEGSGETPLERDEEPETNAAAIAVFPPIAALTLHHPAFTVRRVSDKTDADPNLPKTKSEIAPGTASVEIEAATETPAKIAFVADAAAPPAPKAPPSDSAPGTTRLPAATSDRPAATPELAAPEPADTKAAAPRAIVIEQTTTAPAPMSTAADLADRLAAQTMLISAPAKPEPALQPAAPAPVQAHSLKLQLHPAELGIVTATLRFAGEQLTIELQVESARAHQRLSADSETIVKTLRGLGYEIDRVTIMQPSVASPAPSRSDADPSLAGQSRPDQQASDAGGSNNGGDRLARRDNNQGGEGSPHDRSSNAAGTEDRTGGGLYI